MGTVAEYVKTYGGCEFATLPPNEIDYLIFANISYLGLDGIVAPCGDGITLSDVAQRFFAEKKNAIAASGFVSEVVVPMLRLVASTHRFGECRLSDYIAYSDTERVLQFGAVTVHIPGHGETVVSFRGTDDSLVGWKENLCMSYLSPIPSQQKAQEYLKRALRQGGNVTVCGHSKGGNLAVYAAACVPRCTQTRVVGIWDFDSPGFSKSFFTCDGYRIIKNRIHRFQPESSVFGMMMEHDGDNVSVVKSTAVGIMQHDGFSWQVDENRFSRGTCLSKESILWGNCVRNWMTPIKSCERRRFVDCIFAILERSHFSGMSEVRQERRKLIRAYLTATREQRHVVSKYVLPLWVSWKRMKRELN